MSYKRPLAGNGEQIEMTLGLLVLLGILTSQRCALLQFNWFFKSLLDSMTVRRHLFLHSNRDFQIKSDKN